MRDKGPSHDASSATVEELRAWLADAEETLQAIRKGEVDALRVVDEPGERADTQRSADAPYRALIEQMREGALTLSARGDIVYCNQRFAELVETPLHRVIGSPIESFIADGDRPALRALVAAGVGKMRTRLHGRERSGIEVHVSIGHVVVEDITFCTMIVTDVSTLAKVPRESQSKDEFLAMLAHELRNPLGAIEGAVQVLGQTRLREPRALHARDVIHRQAMHMARLVDDLLDVGRVMTANVALDRQPLDLGECVRRCVATMAAGGKGRSRVVTKLASVWVNADAVRLEQIIGNLISNALKFSPPDQPVTATVSAEGSDAVLCVEDKGTGISPDILPHIFDLFVQADDSRDRAKGGLGIGLTLARQLVELHGGTIEAASPGVNGGSTFCVRLPSAPAPDLAAVAGETAGIGQRSRRVLLVDDHVDVRAMYMMVLEAQGHEVFQAGDGLAAVAMFRAVKPDVAVIDIGLPYIDGYEVAEQIRREEGGQDVALIALTGYGFPEDRERSRAAGFDRHLVKPALPDDLKRELEATARKRTRSEPGPAHA